MEKNSLDSSLELGFIPALLILQVSQIPLSALHSNAVVIVQSVKINPFRHAAVFQHKDLGLQTGFTKEFPHNLKTSIGVFIVLNCQHKVMRGVIIREELKSAVGVFFFPFNCCHCVLKPCWFPWLQ